MGKYAAEVTILEVCIYLLIQWPLKTDTDLYKVHNNIAFLKKSMISIINSSISLKPAMNSYKIK